jgi:phospholipid/cholesterol/gamma-HCH transport system ATP-binding protein
MEESVVEVKDLEIGYEGRVVLKDLSFTVTPGEIFIILGGSAAAKSTLLKHMIGLYDPLRAT